MALMLKMISKLQFTCIYILLVSWFGLLLIIIAILMVVFIIVITIPYNG